MEAHKPLLKDADGEDVDEHLYRSMIRSLMYLTSSRPDIMFAKKQSRRKQRKDTKVSQSSDPTEPMADEAENVESVPTHSNDPLLSGEDRLKLYELMELCTRLSQRVIALETTKTNQALEIDSLKRRVKKLEKKKGSRTHRLRRLFRVGRSAQVVSSEDEGLGAQEDASKQGRKIDDLDVNAEVTLVDEAQERNDDNLMFDTGVLDKQEVKVEKVVSTAEVTTASATTTTTVVTRPNARGVLVQDPSEFTTTTSQPSQLPHAKDKGKEKMVESKKPLKKLMKKLLKDFKKNYKLNYKKRKGWQDKRKKMKTLLNGIMFKL
ncbi:hypothetical protein Tco_0291772 [Tanacetum coccineum]